MQSSSTELSAMMEILHISDFPGGSPKPQVVVAYLKSSYCRWETDFFQFYLILISLNLNSHAWLVAVILESSALEYTLFWDKGLAVFFCVVPATVRKEEILYLSKIRMKEHFLQDVSIQFRSAYSSMTLHYYYYQSKHMYSYPSL